MTHVQKAERDQFATPEQIKSNKVISYSTSIRIIRNFYTESAFLVCKIFTSWTPVHV